MSPEQVRGLPLDRRSDIFALGTMLYESLTGERLFQGETDFATLEKVRNVDIVPPRELNPSIPHELETIILKALARDVEDRYQWCSEMLADLQAFLRRQDGDVHGEDAVGVAQGGVRARDRARAPAARELQARRARRSDRRRAGRRGAARRRRAPRRRPGSAEDPTMLGGPSFDDIIQDESAPAGPAPGSPAAQGRRRHRLPGGGADINLRRDCRQRGRAPRRAPGLGRAAAAERAGQKHPTGPVPRCCPGCRPVPPRRAQTQPPARRRAHRGPSVGAARPPPGIVAGVADAGRTWGRGFWPPAEPSVGAAVGGGAWPRGAAIDDDARHRRARPLRYRRPRRRRPKPARACRRAAERPAPVASDATVPTPFTPPGAAAPAFASSAAQAASARTLLGVPAPPMPTSSGRARAAARPARVVPIARPAPSAPPPEKPLRRAGRTIRHRARWHAAWPPARELSASYPQPAPSIRRRQHPLGRYPPPGVRGDDAVEIRRCRRADARLRFGSGTAGVRRGAAPYAEGSEHTGVVPPGGLMPPARRRHSLGKDVAIGVGIAVGVLARGRDRAASSCSARTAARARPPRRSTGSLVVMTGDDRPAEVFVDGQRPRHRRGRPPRGRRARRRRSPRRASSAMARCRASDRSSWSPARSRPCAASWWSPPEPRAAGAGRGRARPPTPGPESPVVDRALASRIGPPRPPAVTTTATRPPTTAPSSRKPRPTSPPPLRRCGRRSRGRWRPQPAAPRQR